MLRTCNVLRIASLPVLRNDEHFSLSRFVLQLIQNLCRRQSIADNL
ncbi:MAG: hypothetical protein LBM98_08400 [Oscillospiraceae bacterium]|nr:hypothetical protein [Oscillospiraceae bacterium]